MLGAVLQLAMKYTENYNKVPPSINFTTIPFHPNGKDTDSGDLLIVISQENRLLFSLT